MRLWIALFALTAMGQTTNAPCDPDLLRHTNPQDQDRYRARDGRCEGLFAEQVSGSFGNLLVASLTAGVATPNAWTGRPLTVRCRYKEAADIHIQAFPLQPRIYYRLDAVQHGSAISWDWDIDVISKYLKPGNVGVVAWTSAAINGRMQRIYLPVANSATGSSVPLKLIVLPPVAVSEAYITIEATAPGERPVLQRKGVGKGSYLENQRIEIEIPALPHEGLYSVEVTGTADVGNVRTPPFLIYSGK